MQIKLSSHFTYKTLLRFTLPSIAMMIFTSIYSVVDGFFVSNFAGKTAFAAVNIIFPFLMIVSTVGFMFGAGGSALVAKTMGEGDSERANKYFSLFVYVTMAIGVILALLGIIFIEPIAILMGADAEILPHAVLYGRVILCALPLFVLQLLFQSFFITAEKPRLGLAVILACGFTNMVLDAVLVTLFPSELKLLGAALATAISQIVGGLVPLIYFSRKNSSILRLCKTNFDAKALLKACTNGASEFMSNVSMSVVAILYNLQLIKYAGENGVAAYGVMMYVSMIFAATFFGYTMGSAPVISFHYGAQNTDELKGLFRRSMVITAAFSGAMFVLSQVLAQFLSQIFVGYDAELMAMTVHGFRIFSFCFLLMGFAIFGSGFFTALNDGLTSALISFLRTLVFQVIAILVFPEIWQLDGIWISIVAAEGFAVLATAFFLAVKRKKYHYA